MKHLYISILLLFSTHVFSQKIKIVWFTGDVETVITKSQKSKKVVLNYIISKSEKLYIGNKSAVIVEDDKKNLLQITKSGFLSLTEIQKQIKLNQDNEVQRYLKYVLEGMKKKSEKNSAGIPGAPSRGHGIIKMPDTVNLCHLSLPFFWEKQNATDSISLKIVGSNSNIPPIVIKDNKQILELSYYLSESIEEFDVLIYLNAKYHKRLVILCNNKKDLTFKNPLEGIYKGMELESLNYYFQAWQLYTSVLNNSPDDILAQSLLDHLERKMGWK